MTNDSPDSIDLPDVESRSTVALVDEIELHEAVRTEQVCRCSTCHTPSDRS